MRSNEMRLPCGCLMWNEDDVFVFMPHDAFCPYYQYVLEEGARQEKNIQTVTLDD